MTVNASGDAVTCCILQDHKSSVLGNVHSQTLQEIWAGRRLRTFSRASCARSWRAAARSGISRARCSVEGICAQKDVCPNRSYYWSDDLDFRRQFPPDRRGAAPCPRARRSRRFRAAGQDSVPPITLPPLPVR